ncbi:MAG TPA: translation elongation factor Ts [Solirubrobacteraceae bacterium]|nr:translation elongation factor Ts [Solirubrobacteraceae bacterium]
MSADTYSPTAAEVKALRDRTGAGMMDSKKALVEAEGDTDKAIELLRKKQGKRIQDRGERVAGEGTIQTYVHSNAKVGVLVEVNSETDFVARNEKFIQFAKEIALHIAAAAPRYVSEEEIPAEDREREARIFEEQAADKPENIRPKIVEGQLRKWYEEVVLLHQPHVNTDKYEGKTIKQLQDELAAETGVNVGIRRFTRFAIGQ